MFKYIINNREGLWIVGCDSCGFGVKHIHGGPNAGLLQCQCRTWSDKEVKEARDGMERDN